MLLLLYHSPPEKKISFRGDLGILAGVTSGNSWERRSAIVVGFGRRSDCEMTERLKLCESVFACSGRKDRRYASTVSEVKLTMLEIHRHWCRMGCFLGSVRSTSNAIVRCSRVI
jgi:hypothetical protein